MRLTLLLVMLAVIAALGLAASVWAGRISESIAHALPYLPDVESAPN